MIRRPPRSTPLYSSAASDVYKRQAQHLEHGRFDAVLQLGVLPLDVHESDGHAMRLLAAGEVELGTYHSPSRAATEGRRGPCRMVRYAACRPSSTTSFSGRRTS